MDWCGEYDTPLADEGLITEEQCQSLFVITKEGNILREKRRRSSGGDERSSLDSVTTGSKGELVKIGADDKPWVRVLNSSKICCQRQRLPNEKLTKIKGVAKLEGVHPYMLNESFVSSTFRKAWDKNMMDMIVAYELDENNDVIYQSFRYPAILTNRDALYNRYRRFNTETGAYTIIWRSCCHNDWPHNKNLIRSWTVGAYIIEPCPGDPYSSMLYSYGSIDPFGWLPDWFVTQFSPSALKDIISNVTKACLAEQTRRYGKDVKPDYDEIRRSESGREGIRTDLSGGLARLNNGLGSKGGMVELAKPPEHLVNGKKKKRLYTRVLKFFKKQQRGEAVARPSKPSVKKEKKKSLRIRISRKKNEGRPQSPPKVGFVEW